MLDALTLILVCQLAGELLVVTTGLPLPGPVCGMVLMFAGLMIRGGLPQDLGTTADTLLSHLSLLFVPAGVGVMLHVHLMVRDWLPLTVALVISTLATVAVTALLMAWLNRRTGARGGETGQ